MYSLALVDNIREYSVCKHVSGEGDGGRAVDGSLQTWPRCVKCLSRPREIAGVLEVRQRSGQLSGYCHDTPFSLSLSSLFLSLSLFLLFLASEHSI